MNDRQSILERYARKTKPTEPQPVEHRCYTELPVSTLMVDFVLADGSHMALPYSRLETVSFTPSPICRITLTYPDQRIEIHGYRLRPLHAALNQHRLATVRTVSSEAINENDDSPAVTVIDVQQQ